MKSLGILFFVQAVKAAAALVYVILGAYALEPAELGRWAVIISSAGILGSLSNFGSETTLQKRLSLLGETRHRIQINAHLRLKFLICLVTIPVVAIGCFAFEWFEITKKEFLLAAALVWFRAGTFLEAHFIVTDRSHLLLLVRASALACSAMLGFYFIWMGQSSTLVWLALPLTEWVVVFLLLILMLPKKRKRTECHPFPRTISIAEASTFLVVGIAAPLYMKLDLFFVYALIGEDAAGVYAIASRLGEALLIVPAAVGMFYGPRIYKSLNNDEAVLARWLQQGTLISVILCSGLVLIICLLDTFRWGVLESSEYRESWNILVILSLSSISVAITSIQSRWLHAGGRESLIWKRALSILFLNFLLNWTLVPNFGVRGAAIATVVSHTAGWLVYPFLANFGVEYYNILIKRRVKIF